MSEWADKTWVMVKDERPPIMWLCVRKIEGGKEGEGEKSSITRDTV